MIIEIPCFKNINHFLRYARVIPILIRDLSFSSRWHYPRRYCNLVERVEAPSTEKSSYSLQQEVMARRGHSFRDCRRDLHRLALNHSKMQISRNLIKPFLVNTNIKHRLIYWNTGHKFKFSQLMCFDLKHMNDLNNRNRSVEFRRGLSIAFHSPYGIY